MLDKKIEKKILSITTVEQEQLNNNGINICDVKLDNNEEFKKHPILRMPFWNFFDFGRISITKSNRFSYIPAHKHKFIEINYCFSGRSIQYIDDHIIELHPGELIIMDREIQQRINYARKQDILINILIRDDYKISNLLNGINKNSILIKFLKNATQNYFNHHNFIIFDTNQDIVCKQIIENIISIGFNNHGKNETILEALLKSFILCCNDQLIIKKQINFTEQKNNTFEIIQYINENYQNISLRKTAETFGYSTNYLGNLLTKETGHSFKEILLMRRLNIACNLLQTTDYSIEEISSLVGYENHSSLFRLFKQQLGIKPQEYRDRIRYPVHLSDKKEFLPNPYFK